MSRRNVYPDRDAAEAGFQRAIEGSYRLGLVDVAEQIEAEGLDVWLESSGREIAAENPSRKQVKITPTARPNFPFGQSRRSGPHFTQREQPAMANTDFDSSVVGLNKFTKNELVGRLETANETIDSIWDIVSNDDDSNAGESKEDLQQMLDDIAEACSEYDPDAYEIDGDEEDQEAA